MQAAIGVEHQFGKVATLVGHLHQLARRPPVPERQHQRVLPGTYDAATGTGTRPNGINENIYQFQSGGVYNQNQLMLNYTVTAQARLTLRLLHAQLRQGRYVRRHLLPLQPDQPRRRLRPLQLRCPQPLPPRRQISRRPTASPSAPCSSPTPAAPFNITIGQDLNGDNQFNDRPAFATAASTRRRQDHATAHSTSTRSADQARIPYQLRHRPRPVQHEPAHVSKSLRHRPQD